MRRPFILMVVMLIPPGASIAYREIRNFERFPRRFVEVMPHALYRGGYPTADHIRNLHEEKGIRTVMNLTDGKDTSEERQMLDAINQLGLKFYRIKMPGDGRGDFSALDSTADVMATKQDWPIYFHCAAGKQRSNAATAAYLMKHCGWSAERAIKEVHDKYDLDPQEESRLCEHLRQYGLWVEAHRPVAARPMPNRPANLGLGRTLSANSK